MVERIKNKNGPGEPPTSQKEEKLRKTKYNIVGRDNKICWKCKLV